jgi:ornithine cyclodeaminase/alanine dehydrogenase-like protein (mu-crystallin family)
MPARVASWDEIASALENVDVVGGMERAFAAYSAGACVIPPVGELQFEDPPGDVHIKYGYVRGEAFYVVKIASGFYANPNRGLPSSHGLMLLFDQRTGELVAVLLDEGRLTDIRTGAAGAVAARHLAPSRVDRIGILGSGIQARMQLRHLRGVVDCDRVLAWGRDPDRLARFALDMSAEGFGVETARNAAEIAGACNLIVTTTPAESPLLAASDIRPGTHITAVGSDTPGKQELETAILSRADRVIADSIAQCRERGEIGHALRAGCLADGDIAELGAVVMGETGRTTDDEITVADLTGIAVQDVQIASDVYRVL